MITETICDQFYAEKLTISTLKMSYKMLMKLNVSRTRYPSLYFNGSSQCGIRLSLTNTTALFSKVLHICIWMQSLIS
jgi:hypothetical protein